MFATILLVYIPYPVGLMTCAISITLSPGETLGNPSFTGVNTNALIIDWPKYS